MLPPGEDSNRNPKSERWYVQRILPLDLRMLLFMITNVNDVATFVNHNVPIMPVFDLQEVADK